VTRHKLVDMATQVEVAQEFNYRVASRMEAGRDAIKEVSMAKNFACQVCDKVVYDAVQLHGGYGCAREYLVERLYRDSRILSEAVNFSLLAGVALVVGGVYWTNRPR